MTSQTAFSQLQSFLKDMFQFGEHDLDFGIYKVLKMKHQEIERFIGDELPQIVQNALNEVEVLQKKQHRTRVSSFVKQKGGQEERDLKKKILKK